MSDEFVMVPREQLSKIREWIESARDGVLYPIARDFEGVLGRNAEGLGQETPDLMDGIDELLANSAQQHQGEPVTLPARKKTTAGLLSDSNTYNRGWNACLDEIAKLGPLYTHSDPGQVERKLEDQRREFVHAQTVEHRKWAEIFDGLKAQLAERDALLRELDDAWNSHDGKDRFGKLMQKVEALYASAEPSAPLWHRGDVVHSSTTPGKYWECMKEGAPGFWEEKDSTERPFLPSATEPSAPKGLVRDEPVAGFCAAVVTEGHFKGQLIQLAHDQFTKPAIFYRALASSWQVNCDDPEERASVTQQLQDDSLGGVGSEADRLYEKGWRKIPALERKP